MPKEEYIKRSTAEKFLTANAAVDSDSHRRTWAKAICAIKDVPVADVVPAPVRCSDCRFYDKRDGGAPGGTGWCSRPGAGCGVPEEFFCAGAERKEADHV